MDYIKLGSTGLDVSRLCLGCMTYGIPDRGNHAWTLDEETSRPLLRQAVEAGINFFDTANVYSDGTSEEIVGRALRDFTRRDEVVIATKVHGRMRPGPNGEARARHEPGSPCWVSLMVHGPAATQEFYGELFGWEFQPGPQQLGPYVRALLDGKEVAGIGQLPPDRHLPIAWTPYFASTDVDRTADTVRLCGGTVGVGPLDAGETGRIAVTLDRCDA